jgi:hypothetical protein
MPVPGPRTQAGPDSGYRNPDGTDSTFFNLWLRPGPVRWPGRSAGLSIISLRGCQLGAGQIRRLWRQSVDLIPAQGPFSWTRNGNDTDDKPGVDITRALRYMTRSVYAGGGIDNTRFDALHTHITRKTVYKTVTTGRGQTRSRPTVRNRMSSFGSRVPSLNQQVEAGQ